MSTARTLARIGDSVVRYSVRTLNRHASAGIPPVRTVLSPPDKNQPELHPVLETVFRAFEEAGLCWCLLRIPASWTAPGGDVDLLIDPVHSGSARKILQGLEFVPFPAGIQKFHTHFLRYHRPTGCWIWLDIVTVLSFGPLYMLQTGAEAACLARRQRHEMRAVLAPEDAFWALLLHCLLDKGGVAGHHRLRLRGLVQTACADGPLAQVVAESCPPGWTLERMVECVALGDWGALEQLAPSLTTTWLRRHSITVPQILLQQGLWRVDRLVKRFRRRGLSVALLGPDGAGKSTLATAIQKSFIFPVRVVYMGLTGGLLPHVARLRVPGLVLLGRLLVFWGRYLAAQYHTMCGRLVVFDRYIYDAAVPHPERLNWLRRASRWVDGRACPGPDLVLILSAPGEVMYARKRSYSPEQLEDWRRHYLALSQRIPHVRIVDTTQPEHVVHTEAVHRIWQQYSARWEKS